MGRIGTSLAKRAEAFNCSISYHSRTEKQNLNYKYYQNLVELASNCQILVALVEGRLGGAGLDVFECEPKLVSLPRVNNNYFIAFKMQNCFHWCELPTEETRHIVNREVINALGLKGVLINIGRGLLVDEPKLVSTLVEGRLGGAGLDVFEREPKLVSLPRVNNNYFIAFKMQKCFHWCELPTGMVI